MYLILIANKTNKQKKKALRAKVVQIALLSNVSLTFAATHGLFWGGGVYIYAGRIYK
jgi:hypothetical protein